MLSFTDVMNFLAHEFPCLCRWRLPLAPIGASPFQCFLVRHILGSFPAGLLIPKSVDPAKAKMRWSTAGSLLG
jgi:hypothetical protein